ncbi:MAG: gliding motility-associated C-terminal domain-containing protein, partial [Flavobacteriales bacterium]|nr:gliding motility-associated C-terminal domain-containing protein [Flavobacteriales bacterium]
NINILTPDSMMACGDSILIDLDLGGGIPAICGPSLTNACSGPTSQNTIGTGTTNLSNAPSPYYGFYEDGRVQMIYTAAEITATGFIGGKITEISFDVTNKASTQPYNGLTIKIGPTALNDFVGATAFVPGLTQVYTNAAYTTALGWSIHVLNTAYEWDGISNLIVEICFDNTSWTSTDQIAQTNTGGIAMTLYDYTDGAVGCVLNTPYTASADRPNVRFTQCPTIPDPLAFNYSWTPATNIITSTMQNPTVFPSIPTSYIVTVTDTGGNCSDTDTLNVTVLCGACYQPLITVTNPTCKDGTNGSIVVDPTFVFGSEMQSFSWTDSITGTILQTTMNLTAGMMDSLTNIGAGAYTITMVDSGGCSQDTTIYLTEPDSVMINTITADDIVCIGGNIQIDATAIDGNGAPFNYTWTDLSTGTVIPGNGPHTVSPIVSPTCYSVFATDPLGCISSASQVCISLYPNLIANTPNGTPYDTITVCPASADNGPFGTTINMSTIGGSGTGYNYNWYDNGTLIGNGGAITVTPNTPTTYVGVATDDCTTPADSVWFTVNWFDVITPEFTKNKPDSCYPITVEFTNTSTPAALIFNTAWTFSGGATLNGDPVSNTFGTPSCQDATMTVTTTDGCDFSMTKVDYVCPYDYPVANYSMNPPITDLLNTQIQFTNLSTGGTSPYTFLWNFGSGLMPDTSVVTNPNFTYPDDIPGVYPVLLTVTDINGCQDTVLSTVIVNGVYLFYIPNSFTPDGDGINDVFKPAGEGIDFSQYTMQIFDRWGELMYDISNAERGWDGTYKGKPVGAGVYIWKIVAKEEYGTIIRDNYGHVNLIK